AGACGIGLGLGAIGLKPSIPVLFGAQALAGLSELLVIVAGQTYATSLSTGREREQHLGWYTTMVSAGQLVGPLLGGVLADAVGYARSFLTASVLGLLPVLVGTRVRDLPWASRQEDRKSTRLNSSHVKISYAVFCLKKKKKKLQELAVIRGE